MCAGGAAGADGVAMAAGAAAPSVSGALLWGHVFGVAICAVGGAGWVLYDLVWWEQVVVVVPVPSFGASDWFPERRGGCGCGPFVGVSPLMLGRGLNGCLLSRR